MNDQIATINELAERWPLIFGPDGLVNAEEYEMIKERAYSIEIVDDSLRIGFSYTYEEVFQAFEDGADVVGRMAPDVSKITTMNMTDGCIIYIDLGWEDSNV